MSHSAPGRNTRRTLRSLGSVALGFLALAAFAQPASAVTVTGTDPIDASAPGLDLVNAKLDYDPAAGTSSLTVQTAAPSTGVGPSSVYALLGKQEGDQCKATGEDAGVLVYLMIWTSDGEGLQWILSNPLAVGNLSVQRSDTTITATIGADAAIKGLDFNCAQVQSNVQVPDADGVGEDSPVDAMNLFVGGATNEVAPIRFALPTISDQDQDGVPDAKDKCPTAPGGAANGCLTIPDRLAIRLGSKRVVIDKMVARSGAACPLKAKVTVTLKKKTIGSGVVSVSSHGAFCRAYGVVKLKKTVKTKTSVKVVAKATGMASISVTTKR